MRIKSLLLLLVLSCAASAARADDASKLAKVEEFFKVAKLDQLSTQIMKQAMDQVNSGMMQQMTGVKLSEDQQKKVDEFSAKVNKVITGALSWEKLEPEYAKLYAATYTEAQIDDILAFYKSPTGQVMVEKSPVLVKQSSAIAQERMSAAMPELQKLMQDFAKTAEAEQPKQ